MNGDWDEVPHVSYAALFIAAFLVLALIAVGYTALRHRRHAAESDQRICGGCATPHPTRAQFCRKCGKRLGSL